MQNLFNSLLNQLPLLEHKSKQIQKQNKSQAKHQAQQSINIQKNLALELPIHLINTPSFYHPLYGDDEPLPNQVHEQSDTLYDNLEFKINTINQLDNNVSGIVTVNPKNIKLNNIGIDLICIIDKSGSMNGEKIKMVKKALTTLLNYLREDDRLCLITFSNKAKRLTPLLRVTKQNKVEHFEQKIKYIRASGSTDISKASLIALQQIQTRLRKNSVTSIFLLSDGLDNQAEKLVKDQLNQFSRNDFSIHTFGFGDDHDPKMMTQLCYGGSFYFVKELSLLDEFFVDALGGLATVVGKQLKIDLNISNEGKITKTYGNMWSKLSEQHYVIQIPHLMMDMRKDFAFEYQQLSDQAVLLEAQLSLICPTTQKVIRKETNFITDKNIEITSEILAQYFRAKSVQVIEEAIQLTQKYHYDLAVKQIDQFINQILSKEYMVDQLQEILKDLEQAKLGLQVDNRQIFGMQFLYQLKQNNMNQQGINAIFMNGQQQQQAYQGQFQNSLQYEWMKGVQKQKQK